MESGHYGNPVSHGLFTNPGSNTKKTTNHRKGVDMKIISVILVLFALTISVPAFGQDRNAPKGAAEQFLRTLMSGEVDKAYDSLFQGSLLPVKKPGAFDVLKGQTKLAMPVYGKVVGFESVNEQKFGDSIVRLVYVLKFEQHPMIWEFFFYRAKSGWVVSNVVYNDQFQLLGNR